MILFDIQLLISIFGILWENTYAVLLSTQTRYFKEIQIDYYRLYQYGRAHWKGKTGSTFTCANKLVEKGGFIYCYNAGSSTCIISLRYFESFSDVDPMVNFGWDCKAPDNCE